MILNNPEPPLFFKLKEEEKMRIKKTNTILITRIFLLLAIFFFSVSSVNAQQHMPPSGGQHQNPNGHDDAHCEAMGMADGSPHVDPPQNVLDQVAAEYESNCQAGNCFLSEANYQLLESMGHTREKVDCFLQAGEDHHNQQHGGNPN